MSVQVKTISNISMVIDYYRYMYHASYLGDAIREIMVL